VRIELYGIARARAGGTESVEVEAATLKEALRALVELHPELAPEVVDGDALSPLFVASLNGERFVHDPDTRLRAGDAVLILGAQAGG